MGSRIGTIIPNLFGRRALLVAAVALGGMLIMGVLTEEVSAATFPTDEGKIVFSSDRTEGEGVDNPEGDKEIFSMNPDGTGIVQLTHNATDDIKPSYSAKARKIAYQGFDGNDSEIYVMPASGGAPTRLTDNAVRDGDPDLSSDGTRIVLMSDHDLVVVPVSGGTPTTLVGGRFVDSGEEYGSAWAYGSEPLWSPDGTRIAYLRHYPCLGHCEGTRPDLKVRYFTPEGGDGSSSETTIPIRFSYPLSEDEYYAIYNLAWSPDEARIAFTRDGNIFTVPSSGGTATQLTTSLPWMNYRDDVELSFSPDANTIVYSASDGEVHAIPSSGSGWTPTNLTNGPATDESPDWDGPAPVEPPGETRTLTAESTNGGIITGPGISCHDTAGADCDEPYPLGQEVTLSTSTKNGFRLAGWGGDCAATPSSSCALTMDSDKAVSASFEDVQDPSVDLVSAGYYDGCARLKAKASDNDRVSKVEFYAGETRVGEATYSDEYGIYGGCMGGGPTEGMVQFKAVAYDRSGNTSESAARSAMVDYTPPTLTITSGPEDGQTFGADTTLTWTFEARDTLSGLNDPICLLQNMNTWTYSFTQRCNGSFDGWDELSGGEVSHSVSTSGLVDGSYRSVIGVADFPGNARSEERTFYVEATTPEKPAIESPQDKSFNTTGTIKLSGTAEANSTVEMFEGEDSKGTTQANTSGAWSMELKGVPDGPHTYTAKATDAAGNTSASSDARTLIVDTHAPDAPSIGTPAAQFVRLNTHSLTFSGTAEKGAKVELFESEHYPRGEATAGPDGAWSIALSDLSDGSHTFKAKATDEAGNVSVWSEGRWVQVDTTTPHPPSIVSPAQGSFDNDGSFTVSGAAEEYSSVEIFEGEDSRGTTHARTGGAWSMELKGVPDGSHTYIAKAKDAAGNTSASSNARTLIVDTVKPSGSVVINGGSPSTTSRSVRLRLTATDPSPASGVAQVRLRNKGTTAWSRWFTYDATKSWTLSSGAGTKTVYVQYMDRAGNVSAKALDSITYRS